MLQRLVLVADLYWHPAISIQTAVNNRIGEGKLAGDPVSLRTVYEDRRRCRDLLAERVATGMEERLTELQEIHEEAMRSLRWTDAGPARAPLLAVALRAIEDKARLDGSWGAARAPEVPAYDPSHFGSTPIELLEAGAIDDGQYRSILYALEASQEPPQLMAVGGHEPAAAGNSPVSGQVEPRRSTSPRRAGRPQTAPPSMPAPGDLIDLPEVEDFTGDLDDE